MKKKKYIYRTWYKKDTRNITKLKDHIEKFVCASLKSVYCSRENGTQILHRHQHIELHGRCVLLLCLLLCRTLNRFYVVYVYQKLLYLTFKVIYGRKRIERRMFRHSDCGLIVAFIDSNSVKITMKTTKKEL